MSIEINLPDGTKTKGTQIEFETAKEDWNMYKLTGGTLVKLKTVVTEIYRLETKDPATGKNRFLVKSETVIATN